MLFIKGLANKTKNLILAADSFFSDDNYYPKAAIMGYLLIIKFSVQE